MLSQRICDVLYNVNTSNVSIEGTTASEYPLYFPLLL